MVSNYSTSSPTVYCSWVICKFRDNRRLLKKNKKKPCLRLLVKAFPHVTADTFMKTTADCFPLPIINYNIYLPFMFTIKSSVGVSDNRFLYIWEQLLLGCLCLIILRKERFYISWSVFKKNNNNILVCMICDAVPYLKIALRSKDLSLYLTGVTKQLVNNNEVSSCPSLKSDSKPSAQPLKGPLPFLFCFGLLTMFLMRV